MRYREYKGYTIVKEFTGGSYYIRKDGKNLHFDCAKETFPKLKWAKEFLDRVEKNGLGERYYWL